MTCLISCKPVSSFICGRRQAAMYVCACAGYLPGMMYPNIKFFGFMSVSYIFLGVLWAALYGRHWKEVFMLQHCITSIVALGMMEMSTWCVDFLVNGSAASPVIRVCAWSACMSRFGSSHACMWPRSQSSS